MKKETGMTLHEYLRINKVDKIKLHLGCGGTRWLDFINVDLHPYDKKVPDSARSGCVADAFSDMRYLGLPRESISEIFTAHTIEHFTRWEAIDMFKDWYRMAKKGAKIIIETPSFWRCIIWLLHPFRIKRQLGRSQFYGNQWDRLDYETHRYVWSSNEIKKALLEIGFTSVFVTHRTATHHPFRDMRVIAVK